MAKDGSRGRIDADKTAIHAVPQLDAEPEERSAALICISGRSIGQMFVISQEEITLGRAPECDIFLDDEGVSRHHAKVIRKGDTLIVMDLGSTNGTYVDGERIQVLTLTDGLKIQVGTATILQFRFQDEREAEFHSLMQTFKTRDPMTNALNKRAFRLELDKELLRKYYFERGYADFTVLSATAELSPDREGFFITFTVSEGEPYTFGELSSVVNARGLDAASFDALIPSDYPGSTYNATDVDDVANAMTDLAGQKGFAFVQVRPRPRKNAEERIIDLTFQVAEGPRVFIERIEIEGNTQTLDRVIRREIDLVEGDPFDARKIREARRRIRALRFFSSVDLDTERGATEDRAKLTVKVREQSTGSLSFGVGFSTSAGPVGNVALTERNFLGRGQELKLNVTAAGDTQVYDFAFTEPSFLDRDLSVGLRAFLIDDDRSDESSIEISRLGGGPVIGFPLSEHSDISLRYEILREDIAVDNTASVVLQGDAGARLTSRVGYTVDYDRRNDALETTEGYLLTASQDFAGLGGDARYISTITSAKGWTSFFGDEVVTSLEFEAVSIVGFGDDIRFNERFFLGGNNLRGFGDEGAGPRDLATNDSLGGNFRLRSRLQASFPLGLPDDFGIFGGAFVDAGTLFDLDNNDGGRIDDSANLRVSAGGLLFIATPFGPLELSFGFPLVKEDEDDTELFRLSIGTRF